MDLIYIYIYLCHIYKHGSDLYICTIFINVGQIYKSGSLQKGCGQDGRGIAREWALGHNTIVLCVCL